MVNDERWVSSIGVERSATLLHSWLNFVSPVPFLVSSIEEDGVWLSSPIKKMVDFPSKLALMMSSAPAGRREASSMIRISEVGFTPFTIRSW